MVRAIAVVVVLAAIHVAINWDAFPVAAAILFVTLSLASGMVGWRLAGRRRVKYWVVAAILLAAGASAAAWPESGGHVALILPPLVGYMLTSTVFAYSLMPGQEAIIVRLCKVRRGDHLPKGLERYARALTWSWAILPAALALIALVVWAGMGLQAWSWASNVANPTILGTFFVGEHFYRAWRMPHLGDSSIKRTVETMLNTSFWPRSPQANE